MFKKAVFATLASAVLFAVPAHAAGDAAAGEKVFVQCKACHENEKGVNKVGPTLKGVVGRKTASVPDYKYSAAMAAKGAEGLVWTEENLTAYLPNPKAYVPGTKMAFGGLKKPEDVANVIAYLAAHP
jgi:cytochrome c